MLGGNAEYLAKAQLRKNGMSDELLAECDGHAETDNPEILAARQAFAEAEASFKAEIREEAEKVRAAGGLYILGTERHESRRIDNQLRGRAGRQGDPGESRFFLSLEDDIPAAVRVRAHPGHDGDPGGGRGHTAGPEDAVQRH